MDIRTILTSKNNENDQYLLYSKHADLCPRHSHLVAQPSTSADVGITLWLRAITVQYIHVSVFVPCD